MWCLFVQRALLLKPNGSKLGKSVLFLPYFHGWFAFKEKSSNVQKKRLKICCQVLKLPVVVVIMTAREKKRLTNLLIVELEYN